MLHVNTKPWYETDDKVVLKETKKYGDIYLNKLFEVSINHLNKSPVILIHIIWFLEEVCKKKSVTLRTLVYDFLKVRKNQQMSPHRVGLFLLLPLISFHCGITMCVFTAEYITVVSLWQKIAFQGVLRQQRCHAKSTLRISSLVSDQILLMDGFSSLQQWASKSEELLRVSRENSGQSAIPRANGSIFHGNFSKYTQKYMMSFAIYPWNNTNNKTLTAVIILCIAFWVIERTIFTWNSTPRLQKMKTNFSV